jgi:Helix-turn-helix
MNNLEGKTAVYNIVTRAIRNGTLIRQSCEVCGKSPAHAHHEDYRKPLDVRWLCALHHGAEHRRIRAIGLVPGIPSRTEILSYQRRLEIKEAVAELKEWNSKGISESYLAERIGVSEPSVKGWLNGSSAPTIKSGLKIQSLLKGRK